MTIEATSAAIPPTFEWTLYNRRRSETRTYIQQELTIDGEARLVQMGTKIGAVLADGGYTWADLWDLTDERNDIDWVEVSKMVGHLSQFAPDLVADAATVMLGVFATDEDGRPEPDYHDHVRFIRGAINVSRFVDMVRVFLAQNDYARVLAPFSRSLSGTMDAFSGGAQGDTSATEPEPSSGQPVMASDGSTVLVDPITTNPTATASGTETATSSGASSD